LAERARISGPYLGRLERGETAPGIDLVDRLAQAFGTKPAELLPVKDRDPIPVLHEQLKRNLADLIGLADRSTLTMLNILMASLRDAAARNR
jgi:transcriptional regulator with XRE-family HTH domain